MSGKLAKPPRPREVRRARRQVADRFEAAATARWLATQPPSPTSTTLTLTVRRPKSLRELRSAARRGYGDRPLHLLAMLASLALVGYVVSKARLGPLPVRMGVWFVASFLAHDLVLFPLYALADRTLSALTSRLPRRRASVSVSQHAAGLNAVRVPLFTSLLLLLVFQGPIRHQGDASYAFASHLHEINYFARWLLTSAVLFLASGAWYAVRAGSRRPTS